MTVIEETYNLNGQLLTVQVGKLAKAATTAVFARLGETCVLVTLTIGRDRSDIDYLPLQVEYVEKLYAGGRIKGSRWVKREGRPSDDAILKARLIDRSIRPLFPANFRREIQIIITLLSVDGINSPEILSAIATSAAVHISPIPWQGPIGTIRVGYVKNNGQGALILNPTEDDQIYSDLDLVVSSTSDKVVMIETRADQLPEALIIKAISQAKEENKKICHFIDTLAKKINRPKMQLETETIDGKLESLLMREFRKHLDSLILKKAEKEFDDEDALQIVVEQVLEKYKQDYDRKEIEKAIDYISKKMIRDKLWRTKKRIDGRLPDDIRPLSAAVSVLPRTHGSALFERGDTQVMSIVTLGAPRLEQLIESPEGEEAKHYIHHYYMPPYSVGETGRLGFPSRREIGHGALAEKALEPVLPDTKEFPYTIRVVSEVMSSNGSTSMAATCGSTLALMDAGVPIKAPVAGIAMGLLTKNDLDYLILTDIAGIEDFSGEMDFKVAGTKNGVTAIQLDVKNLGLTDEMIKNIFVKARIAINKILGVMEKAIAIPRRELSKYAPKVVVLTPPQDKIGEVIGPGGKNIRALIAKTQTEIDIAENGSITVSGVDKDKVDEAVRAIENITREIVVGEEFVGEVKRILPFGAFIELVPGKEGLVHVSKMGVRQFVRDPRQVVKIGQKVKVKVYQIDNQGRINLQIIR